MMSDKQRVAISNIKVPDTAKDAAFRLDYVTHKIEELQQESLALQYRLSRERDMTVVSGDEYDLLIKTFASTASVTRCHKGK